MPEDRLWRVTFHMTRTVEVRGTMSGTEAEEKARDQVLFKDDPPIDREDIDTIETVWVDEKVDLAHLDGCQGNHCRHYDCCTNDEDYREFCVNCDPE